MKFLNLFREYVKVANWIYGSVEFDMINLAEHSNSVANLHSTTYERNLSVLHVFAMNCKQRTNSKFPWTPRIGYLDDDV